MITQLAKAMMVPGTETQWDLELLAKNGLSGLVWAFVMPAPSSMGWSFMWVSWDGVDSSDEQSTGDPEPSLVLDV